MANFESDFFERRGNERKSAQIVCVTVALNDLRSDWRHGQAEALADARFDVRAEMRSVANGAGNFTDGHLRGGFTETRDVTLIFREPVGNLQPEGDGLGMN